MKNSDLGLKARMMDALSVEALPSYGFGAWSVGPHLDYRWQAQITSLANSGGTNLKGEAYFIGLGVRREFTERLFVQGAIDFVGEYDFGKNTSIDQDDKLTSPLELRLKTGYVFIPSVPRLTFDADLQYMSFRNIRIAGINLSAKTSEIMVAVGLTYRLGGNSPGEMSEPKAESASPSTNTQNGDLSPTKDAPNTAPALGAAADSPTNGEPEIAFAIDSSELTESSKAAVDRIVTSLAQNPAAKIKVDGHTDSTGTLLINGPLSRKRAASVRTYLTEKGIAPNRIVIKGYGPSRPIGDNASEAGRAQNRRVEIHISGGPTK